MAAKIKEKLMTEIEEKKSKIEEIRYLKQELQIIKESREHSLVHKSNLLNAYNFDRFDYNFTRETTKYLHAGNRRVNGP